MPTTIPLSLAIAPWIDDVDPPLIDVAVWPIARRFGDDGRQVLSYLTSLTGPIETLEDIEAAIASLADEEELASRWVSEGLLVSHASDGWFLLYLR